MGTPHDAGRFGAVDCGMRRRLCQIRDHLGIPVSEQVLYGAFSLSHIHGGGFQPRFLPDTLKAYLDPTHLRLTRIFPYITFPPQDLNSTQLFDQGLTASALTSIPLLFGAGVWGVITTFAPRRPKFLGALGILLIAMVTAGSIMIFGWIFDRYVADFMPLLMLASMIGMVDVWRRLEGRLLRPRLGVLAVTCLLALFGFVTNMGLAVTPNQNWTPQQSAHYVEVQKALSDVTGHPLSHDIVRGTAPPALAPMGELFVLGNCDALYVDEQPMPNGLFIPPNLYWLLVSAHPTPICVEL